MEKVLFGSKEYNVVGYARAKDENGNDCGSIPIIDFQMMSDYTWLLISLESRLQHPEYYINCEDVELTKKKIRQTILEKTIPELYQEHCVKYKICYDYIFDGTEEAIAV